MGTQQKTIASHLPHALLNQFQAQTYAQAPGIDAAVAEVIELLDAAPWTLHADHGLQQWKDIPGMVRDQDRLKFISRNVDLLNAGIADDRVPAIVKADIAAFQNISSIEYQRHAAEEITSSVSDHAAYKAEFRRLAAQQPELVAHIGALNTMTKMLVQAKDARKEVEFAAMNADPKLQRALAMLFEEEAKQPIPTSTGMHFGPIVTIRGHMACQKTGRGDDSMVWHDMNELRGPSLVLGQHVEIAYLQGNGKVADFTQHNDLANGVGR